MAGKKLEALQTITDTLGMSFGEFFDTMLSTSKLKAYLMQWGPYIFKAGFFLTLLDWMLYSVNWLKSGNKAGNTYGLLRRTIQVGVAFCGGFLVAFVGIQLIVLLMTGLNIYDGILSLLDACRMGVMLAFFDREGKPEGAANAYLSAISARVLRGIISLTTAAVLIVCLIFKVIAIVSFITAIVAASMGGIGIITYLHAKFKAAQSPQQFPQNNQSTSLTENPGPDRIFDGVRVIDDPKTQKDKNFSTYMPDSLMGRLAGFERFSVYNEYASGKYYINEDVLGHDILNFLEREGLSKEDKTSYFSKVSKVEIIKTSDGKPQIQVCLVHREDQKDELMNITVPGRYSFQPGMHSMNELEFLVQMYLAAKGKNLFKTNDELIMLEFQNKVPFEFQKDSSVSIIDSPVVKRIGDKNSPAIPAEGLEETLKKAYSSWKTQHSTPFVDQKKLCDLLNAKETTTVSITAEETKALTKLAHKICPSAKETLGEDGSSVEKDRGRSSLTFLSPIVEQNESTVEQKEPPTGSPAPAPAPVSNK